MNLNSRAETHGQIEPGHVYAEAGTITHEGREFTSGGAFVSDGFLNCYIAKDCRATTWEGRMIGRATKTGEWLHHVPNCWHRVTLESWRVRLFDGREYVGRKSAEWDLFRGRRAKR